MSRQSRGPTVVLAGRPNVGKSTLFNRITGTRRSIVAPLAGTTRDTIRAPAVWQNRPFTLFDTGGLFGASTDPLHELVVEHGLKALESADILVLVLDAKDGLVAGDHDVARRLRAFGRPILAAVNKTDDRRGRERAVEFHQLGIEPVIEVAAEHGDGVADLLDEIVRLLPSTSPATDAEPELSIAVVGRPNVGKSSLVNRLVREDRVMVSDVPGTTRDAIDVPLQWRTRQFRLVDTAGMRRPGRVAGAGSVEAVSVIQARRAMADADVVVMVIDAVDGAGDRDAAIAGAAQEAGCGVVIAVNKWDLVKGQGEAFVRDHEEQVRHQIKFLDYAPLVRLSALTGERTERLLETINRVAAARRQRVPTGKLNQFLEEVTSAHRPIGPTHRPVKVLYGAQTGVAPPSFVLFTNTATSLHFSYERYLHNRLRETFGFEGTPLRIAVRRKPAKRRSRR